MFRVQLLLFVSNYKDLFPTKRRGIKSFRLLKNVGIQIGMKNIYICNFSYKYKYDYLILLI